MFKYSSAFIPILLMTGPLLRSSAGLAETMEVSHRVQPRIEITLPQQNDRTLRLEVRQASLGQVLKAFADKTGTRIHYSLLPETRVTATCVGVNARQVMDCLVAKHVGVIAKNPKPGESAEFWLLDSSEGNDQAKTIEPAAEKILKTSNPQPEPMTEEQAQSDQLLKQAKAPDPLLRAEALANLIAGGLKNDPNVRKVLEEAMTDKDATVRAQAITALASREGEGATEQLHQALLDQDVNVRMMAVENAGNNTELLQLALSDRSNSVREYANQKLEALNTLHNEN